MCSNEPRIKIYRQQNMGLTKSLNWLIKRSRGTYIARQDSDDISAPDRIEEQISFLTDNPSVAMIGTGCLLIDSRGRVLRRERVKTRPNTLRRLLLRTNQFIHGSVMIHSDILKASENPYREECRYAQDYDLFLRISEKHMVANIDRPLYQYRITSKSISTSKIRDQLHVGMIVQKAAQMRRRGMQVKWSKKMYNQIEASLNTPLHRRRLEHLVCTAKGRNLLLTQRITDAQQMFWRAFVTWPAPKTLLRLLWAFKPNKYLQ